MFQNLCKNIVNQLINLKAIYLIHWGKLTVYTNTENLRNYSIFLYLVTMTIRKPYVSYEGYVSLQKLNRGITLKPVRHNVV